MKEYDKEGILIPKKHQNTKKTAEEEGTMNLKISQKTMNKMALLNP